MFINPFPYRTLWDVIYNLTPVKLLIYVVLSSYWMFLCVYILDFQQPRIKYLFNFKADGVTDYCLVINTVIFISTFIYFA